MREQDLRYEQGNLVFTNFLEGTVRVPPENIIFAEALWWTDPENHNKWSINMYRRMADNTTRWYHIELQGNLKQTRGLLDQIFRKLGYYRIEMDSEDMDYRKLYLISPKIRIMPGGFHRSVVLVDPADDISLVLTDFRDMAGSEICGFWDTVKPITREQIYADTDTVYALTSILVQDGIWYIGLEDDIVPIKENDIKVESWETPEGIDLRYVEIINTRTHKGYAFYIPVLKRSIITDYCSRKDVKYSIFFRNCVEAPVYRLRKTADIEGTVFEWS